MGQVDVKLVSTIEQRIELNVFIGQKIWKKKKKKGKREKSE